MEHNNKEHNVNNNEKENTNIIHIGDHKFKPYFSETEIQSWIHKIALKINKDYASSNGLHIIVIFLIIS